MQQFEISLKDNRQNRYLNFLLFSILLNVMLFSWMLSTATHSFIMMGGLIFSVLLLVLHVSKKWNKIVFSPHYLLIVFVLCWIAELEWLPALLNIIFIFSAVYLNKKILITVNVDGMIIHSYPKKIFAWKEADNVLIKDGLMTIDLLNNKLFQFAVEEVLVNENDFNDFCKNCISANRPINQQSDNFAS